MSYLSTSREGYLLAESSQQAYINESMRAYNQARTEINEKLKTVYLKMQDKGISKDDYYKYIVQHGRLEALEKELTKVYAKYSKLSGKSTQAGLETAMTESYNRQLYLNTWVANTRALPINENLLKYSTTGSIDAWKKIQSQKFFDVWGNPKAYSPQAGTLTQLLGKNATKELEAVLQSVQSGFLQGKSYSKVSNEIRTIIGTYSNTAAGEVATGAKYNALRIARTEGNRVLNGGAYANAQQLEAHGIKSVKKWISTLDGSTRDTHQELDGQEVGINETFKSSDGGSALFPGDFGIASEDINCHCSYAVVPEGVNPQLRRARNPETGNNEVISFTDYNSWTDSKNL